MKNIISAITVFIFLFIFSTYNSWSQIVAPSGINTRASSQLVYWYDEVNETSPITVTNTNDTQGVWIHVQIFRNFDPDNPGGDGNRDGDEVICDERDFIDFLTPNDTHVYDLYNDAGNLVKNVDESEINAGESTNISVEDTIGFVVITPVVSDSDLSAISFQYLFGTGQYTNIYATVNAMGRDAVDFTTGEIVPDNTPLDGTSNGFRVIQPDEFLFNSYLYSEDIPSDVDVIGIAFRDNYGSAGLLGYNITSSEMNWTSFTFDFKEDPTSCGSRTISCFDQLGLDDNVFTIGSTTGDNNIYAILGEAFLCQGYTPPANFDGDINGWTRIFVSGLDDFTSAFGLFAEYETGSADWMFTKGEPTDITPPPTNEICDDEAMADEDGNGFANCLDPACATAANCETGAEECADTVDNDSDGKIDCLDEGCDGFAGCEFGTEVSCDDGIDNDADGQTDCNDTDCASAEACGGGTTGGGGGGGCSVATSVTTATAAANMLLPLLPLFGAYGIRKRRR